MGRPSASRAVGATRRTFKESLEAVDEEALTDPLRF
jgi:hypothetical protein